MIYIVYKMRQIGIPISVMQTKAQRDEIGDLLGLLDEKEVEEYLGKREFSILKTRSTTNTSYDDIGRVYGVTRERIRQVVHNALAKLRFLVKKKIPDVVITEVPIVFQRFLRKGEWVTYQSTYYRYGNRHK